MEEIDKEKLRKRHKRFFKSTIASAGLLLSGVIIMGLVTYFTEKTPKPSIYQTYQNTQHLYSILERTSRDLENIPKKKCIEDKIKQFNDLKLSFKKDLKYMEESPELKQYHEKIMKYSYPSMQIGGSLMLLGFSGMIPSLFLCLKYEEKMRKK